jgi:hypothetical protein
MPVTEARRKRRRQFEMERARKYRAGFASIRDHQRPDTGGPSPAEVHAAWFASLSRSKYRPHQGVKEWGLR